MCKSVFCTVSLSSPVTSSQSFSFSPPPRAMICLSPFTSPQAEPLMRTPSLTAKSRGSTPMVDRRMRRYTLSTLTQSPTAADHWRSWGFSPEVSIQ